MTTPYQEEIRTLAERAKEYFGTIRGGITAVTPNNNVLIIGLDPKGKKYWIGETESSILEQKKNESNENLVYFMKLSSDIPNKLFMTAQ